MTRSYLNINVAIGRPYDMREVLRQCRMILGTPDEVPPLTVATEHELLPSGLRSIAHPLHWVAPAKLWIDYGIDGPMRELPDGPDARASQAAIDQDPTRNGWAAAKVTFSPVFWWPEISSAGATDRDLAAYLTRGLGRWLDHRHIPWQWEAEGASTYIPYDLGRHTTTRHAEADLRQLGDADRGAITAQDAHRVNEMYLADWQTGWREHGPDGSMTLLPGWNPTPARPAWRFQPGRLLPQSTGADHSTPGTSISKAPQYGADADMAADPGLEFDL